MPSFEGGKEGKEMTEKEKDEVLKMLKENPKLMKQYYAKIMQMQMQKSKPVSDKFYLSKDFDLKDWVDKDGGLTIEPT